MDITNTTQLYPKHLTPLESSLSLLNDLIRGMGVPGRLVLTNFEDELDGKPYDIAGEDPEHTINCVC